MTMQLSANGSPAGWLGENDGPWCIVTSEDAAAGLETYVYDNVTYYRNARDTSR